MVLLASAGRVGRSIGYLDYHVTVLSDRGHSATCADGLRYHAASHFRSSESGCTSTCQKAAFWPGAANNLKMSSATTHHRNKLIDVKEVAVVLASPAAKTGKRSSAGSVAQGDAERPL